jgi:predicted NBD/HSP70 family sugar kinase
MGSKLISLGFEPEDGNNGVSYKKYLLKKQIIEIFYREGHKAITELCDITNNSVPNITNIIGELSEEGWVTSYGIGTSKGGRKPTLYGINTNAGYVLGIDLSRRYTRMSLFNLHNEHVGDVVEYREGLENTENILGFLKDAVDALLKNNGLGIGKVLGFGIAIPGLIDIRKGVSYSYPQLGSNPLEETFEGLFGRPVFVEHDTRIMAIGEKWFGLAKDISDVLFLNVGSGLGMSMILNDNLYRGHSGFSGEFGHIQMDQDGELCYCGKIGCLETIASGTAIVNKAKTIIRNGKNTLIARLVENDSDKIKLKTIIDAGNMGDQFAIELLEGTSEYLARGISILIHLFNPGPLSLAARWPRPGTL